MIIKFLIVLFSLIIPEYCFASAEQATFGALYQESPYINWIPIALGSITAGILCFYTACLATPYIASFGTWIGNSMGYSGIAAQNAGLALFGGGAIAKGGLGIVGGTAVIHTAIAFSEAIIIDYSLQKFSDNYSYQELVNQSKNLVTLPLPKNKKGPLAYKKAMNVLKDFNQDDIFYSHENRAILNHAIDTTLKTPGAITEEDFTKIYSLAALLYFINNNYLMAKKYSNAAMMSANSIGIRTTLPKFIHATSILYDENVSNDSVVNADFKYSIIAEPDNPLIPLLFNIYMDRVSLRVDSGSLTGTSLYKVYQFMVNPDLDMYMQINVRNFIERYIARIFVEQQIIFSLSTTESQTIRSDPDTLVKVKHSLSEFETSTNQALKIINLYLAENISKEYQSFAMDKAMIVNQYINDTQRLKKLIHELETYQNGLKQPVNDKSNSSRKVITDDYISLVFVMIIIVSFAFAKYKYRKSMNNQQ